MKNNRLVYILLCLLNLSWANARNKQQEAEALIKKSVEALYNNPKQASYYAAKVIEFDALTHESWNRKDSQVIFRTAEEGAEKKQRDVLALSKPVNVAEPCS